MLFSVTIPAYKKQYLKECIDSILAQTYTDFELIIVNDASPEDLDSIVNCYSDDRLRYYKNGKNCGAINVVDNWNKCLEYSKGDYIICMGDDDRLQPNCLEVYSALIDKYPGLGVYHAWTELIDENSDFLNVTAARCEYESVYSLIWHQWNGRNQQFIGDFLFDTRLLKKNGGFYKLPLAWASDDISACIAASYKGIANTQAPCFSYRVNSQTITNSGNALIKMDAILKEMDWYNTFLQREPVSQLDKKYWVCIKRQYEHHFEQKRGIIISGDLRQHSIVSIFRWWRQRKKYGLSNKILLYAICLAMK